MVAETIADRGVRDPRVLDALRAVPRERFIPPDLGPMAYADHPLPIGHGQTISQPYIVAFMAEALALRGAERVLEVGCGCGYAAAVLARLCAEVRGLDLEADLVAQGEATLAALGIANVQLRVGDGARGWPEAAPFEAILVSCAAPEVPEALWDQLAEGGHLVMPLGPPHGVQELIRLDRLAGGQRRVRTLLPVAFVPLRRP